MKPSGAQSPFARSRGDLSRRNVFPSRQQALPDLLRYYELMRQS